MESAGIFEVEVKAPVKDADALINAILKKGAGFLKSETNSDIYYNHPSRDFAETDEAFRIRKVDNKYFFTYKGPKIGTAAKSRIERELEINDYETAREIVSLLGFRETGRVNKQREIYTCGDITICIDNVDGLGVFVEIEKTGPEREPLEKEVIRFASELGISGFERRSYLEMILK